MEAKKVTILIVLALTGIAFLGGCESFEFDEKELDSEDSLWKMYERWRSHHTLSRDLADKKRRFNVFKQNAMHVHDVNKQDKPYKLKLNKFADLTNHEFRNLYASSKISHHRMFRGSLRGSGKFMYENVSDVPTSVDWRDKGAVTRVKNQGQCGSCWAFSTVAAVEGINYLKTNKLVALSEQMLMDCDTDWNQGCNGGLMEYAFEFIQGNGGITAEENYPYTASNERCNLEKSKTPPVVTINGYENVPGNNEDALLKAVANQPVSVAIEATDLDFQLYSEGVFTGRCGTGLDHGVVVVGYGVTVDGTNYWIVKNSWGPEWGEQGSIRMKRGISAKEGLCGIAMDASYPIKENSDNPKAKAAPSSIKDEL